MFNFLVVLDIYSLFILFLDSTITILTIETVSGYSKWLVLFLQHLGPLLAIEGLGGPAI